jgi:folylpolyglutamate synthase/dihydropteroate synthase
VERVAESVEHALNIVDPDDLVLVTGSVYLVGEAREHWYPNQEMLRALSLHPSPQMS